MASIFGTSQKGAKTYPLHNSVGELYGWHAQSGRFAMTTVYGKTEQEALDNLAIAERRAERLTVLAAAQAKAYDAAYEYDAGDDGATTLADAFMAGFAWTLKNVRAEATPEQCPECGCRREADIHAPGYSCDYYTRQATPERAAGLEPLPGPWRILDPTVGAIETAAGASTPAEALSDDPELDAAAAVAIEGRRYNAEHGAE